MNNVIVKQHNGEWIVTLPEYPEGQCWSTHGDDKFDAVAEANNVCEDLGYDNITVEA